MDGSDSPGSGSQKTPAEADARPPAVSIASADGEGFMARLLRRAGVQISPSADAAGGSGGTAPALHTLTPAEMSMVNRIARLSDLRVDDVMTPRADILAVPEDAALDAVIDAFRHGSFSRLPVYRETLDDPVGFVHLKDVALEYWSSAEEERGAFRLGDHIHTALFVPPSMRIVALLQRMQGARVHMALVIDEFGGVDGLVTIEDLVEQIVGDIDDEHDDADEVEWSVDSPGVYSINARADIREFEESTGIRLLGDDWEEEADTMGGLVFMLANRVPTRGEVISHPAGHEFQVTDADPRRIKRLRLTLNGVANTSNSVAMRQAAE